MRRSASISWAHRLSTIWTWPLPKISCWKMSERLAWGSTENTSTLLPCRASHQAVAAENVVFPSPPLPPNMTVRGSEDGVGDILLPQHPSLPRRDLRDHVGRQPQRVVGGQDRDAEHVAHGDQDEQVLHAGPGAHGMARHVVRGHPVGDLAELAQEAPPPLGLLTRLVGHPASPLFKRFGGPPPLVRRLPSSLLRRSSVQPAYKRRRPTSLYFVTT